MSTLSERESHFIQFGNGTRTLSEPPCEYACFHDECKRQRSRADALRAAKEAVVEAAIEERATFEACQGPAFNAESYNVWQAAGSRYSEAVAALRALLDQEPKS